MTEHRKAHRPRWGGRHGTLVKGSVKKDGDGWSVFYSYLLGYETTLRHRDQYVTWGLAMSEYREHDRKVRAQQTLEDFRSGRTSI